MGLWGRISVVLNKSYINVSPPETVTINVQTIKNILSAQILQSFITAMVFSIRDGIGTAWLMPVFTILQIGWVWDKVLFSWGDQSESIDGVPKVVPTPFISMHHPATINTNSSINTNNSQFNSTSIINEV
jgi:hypothetical protein